MKKTMSQGVSFPDQSLYDYAKAQADSENRKLSNWICSLIIEHRRAREASSKKDLSPATKKAVVEIVKRG